jgi:hypothetical protein
MKLLITAGGVWFWLIGSVTFVPFARVIKGSPPVCAPIITRTKIVKAPNNTELYKIKNLSLICDYFSQFN